MRGFFGAVEKEEKQPDHQIGDLNYLYEKIIFPIRWSGRMRRRGKKGNETCINANEGTAEEGEEIENRRRRR
jgi:hypothetical protein